MFMDQLLNDPMGLDSTSALIGALVLTLFVIFIPLPQSLGFGIGMAIIGLYTYGLITSNMLDALPALSNLSLTEISAVFFGITFVIIFILIRIFYLSATKEKDSPFMPPFSHVVFKCLFFSIACTALVYAFFSLQDPSGLAHHDHNVFGYEGG